MDFFSGSVILYFLSVVILSSEGNHDMLKHMLHHYETLHHSDITYHHHITKRRADNGQIYHQKVISFDTLGRHFKLHLTSCRHLFTNDFKAVIVYPDSGALIHEDLPLNTADFFEGYIENDTNSVVSAYWENDDLVARIRTKDDTYIVEPLWRHLSKSDGHHMLVYKASDVKTAEERNPGRPAGASFCGSVNASITVPTVSVGSTADDDLLSGFSYIKNTTFHGRYKRQAGSSQVCTIALVADYRFTQNVGDQNAAVTAKYMAGVLSTVNDIYTKTNFGYGYLGTGFEIRSITVYTNPTSSPEFNRDQALWPIQDFLNSFGKENWSDYCLAHLFTYQGFNGGVQGLAWVASPKSNEVGGICSPVYLGRHYNTAWTSHKNSFNGRILAQEADLVTAHELGHNWGSPHDPTSCAPSVFDGGKYLMYQYSVSGFDPNNNHFSSCSISSIGSVLKSKAPSCFTTRSSSFCGNFHVEDGEECDAGTAGLSGLDRCCTNQCRLQKTAQCSDANSMCCQNCQFKTKGEQCRAKSVTTCEDVATCTGSSADCPVSDPLPDGFDCVDKGKCLHGTCIRFCESKQLISCSCDTLDTACKYCCRSSLQSECVPYTDNGGPFSLPDGRSCYAGICVQGICNETKLENTARLWDIIQNFNINAILKWMKDNIVLATIVISLVLYIPLCLIVFCIDRRIAKKEEEELEWHSRNNDQLIKPGDNKQIFKTYRRKRQPDKYTSLSGSGAQLSVSEVLYN